MNVFIFALPVYILWNIIVFSLYGIDKGRAKRGEWRISEKALLLPAILMGGIGALLGMYVFRHKTKHLLFRIGIPLAVAANIALVAVVLNLLQ